MTEPTFTPKLGDGFIYRAGNKDYPARIIALDAKCGNGESIIALVRDGEYEIVYHFDADGNVHGLGGVVRLIDAPPKPTVTQKWVNLYSDDGALYGEHQQHWAKFDRSSGGSCVKLTFHDKKLVEVEICDD